MATAELEYVEPARVVIDGVPCQGLTVRVTAGHVVGQLRGCVIDPINQRLRYFVVRASRLLGGTRVVPAVTPRLDTAHRAIEIDLSDQELRRFRKFTLEHVLGPHAGKHLLSAS